ncbi:hypothetical protein WKT22_01153 [Candidatus Lokiarchaeum ossiferum]
MLYLMGLSWKKRTFLVVLVYSCYLFALILSPISQRLENKINFREAYFFDGDQYVEFEIFNYTSQDILHLRLDGCKINATHTQVTITLDSNVIGTFWMSPEGWVYQNNTKMENIYSPWWVYVPNVVVFAGVSEGDLYEVMDPTGFFGNSSTLYQYEVIDKFVFYPVLAQHRNLSGAQASFEATLYDSSTHQKHGSFIFDTTSGALEQADVIIDGHWCQILLTDTSYEISRNRYVLVIFNVLIGLFVGLIIWVKKNKEQKSNQKAPGWIEPKWSSEFLYLFFLGVVCTTLDIVDTWFYHGVGFLFSILLDFGYIILLALACKKWHYGYKWILPALFEFIYARPLRGRMFIPYIGTTLAWFAIIWASGVVYQKYAVIKSMNKDVGDLGFDNELNKWEHPMEKII